MIGRKFRVRYYLQCLQTRSNPLFSNIKAYILSESLKRFLGEGANFKNNRLLFQATLQQQNRTMQFNTRTGSYEDHQISILLEFDADGRYIKMGESVINLAKIINTERNGEILGYKVDKCYDRNARILMGVTLEEIKSKEGESEREDLHSRSHCQLPPPRMKIRTTYEKNKMNATEYSQLTDREEKDQEMSLVSDKHNSYLTAGRTVNRTQVFRKPQRSTNNQQILELKTQNRIYQHQIAQLQHKFREIQQQVQTLKQQLSSSREQNYHMQSQYNDLKKQFAQKDQLRQSSKQHMNTELARILKLYQESEQERNKLLIEREENSSKEKEKIKEFEKRVVEEKGRIKQMEKSENNLKKKIEEYMAQIALYQKAVRSEQKAKERLMQSQQSIKNQKQKLLSELQTLKQKGQKDRTHIDELQSELQISKFSLVQLQRQLTKVKSTNSQLAQAIKKYQRQLSTFNETIKTQRSHFSRKIKQISYQSQCQQKNIQAYVEQLQIKTINEQSKNNQINSLKRQIAKIKQQLSIQCEKNDELEGQMNATYETIRDLQIKVEQYHSKLIELSRQKALIQNELKARRQLQMQESFNDQQGISSQEREELITQCYRNRDQIWKKQIQKIENDTRLLLEKTRKEKEQLINKVKKLNEELAATEQSLAKMKSKLKKNEEENERYQKESKDFQSKLNQVKRQSGQIQADNHKKDQLIEVLKKKCQTARQQFQETLSQMQKKLHKAKQQYNHMKSQLQKQRSYRQKLRSDMREFISTATGYLGKSQKHKIFYDQIRSELIDAQLLLMFNSSAKLFCEKHNRLKSKLQQLQQLKGRLQSKQQQCEKINKSLRDERKSQGGSCDSNTSFNKSQSQSTTKLLQFAQPPVSRLASQKEEIEIKALKKEIDELKGKLRRQGSKYSEIQRELQKSRRNIEDTSQDLKKAKDEIDLKQQQITQLRQKLKSKQRQLQSTKSQNKQLISELSSSKNELQQISRALKQSQMAKMSTVLNRSFNSNQKIQRTQNDASIRNFQLQKKLRSTQQQLQKLKKQKQLQKNDGNVHSKQYKQFEVKLKEKEQLISSLRETIDQQREKTEQMKQLHSLKVRKLKEQFEEQLQNKLKIQKQLTLNLTESQERNRTILKKIKVAQQNLRNANTQIMLFTQKQEKGKRLIVNQWQLKMKTLQGQHQAQIITINRKIQTLKQAQRNIRQGQKKKHKQMQQLKVQLQKRERVIVQLSEKLQLFDTRIRNMQQEQSNYIQTIGALESKMKIESAQQKKNPRQQQQYDRDTFDNRSNFSLKTFTFR